MAYAPTPYWRLDVDPPEAWDAAFAELTSEPGADHWGLRAAIYIARIRRRAGRGPTFAELFEHLAQSNPAFLPQPLDDSIPGSQRRAAGYAFRRYVCIEWRRREWINWGPQPHSLRVGQRFRHASRAHIARRRAAPSTQA